MKKTKRKINKKIFIGILLIVIGIVLGIVPFYFNNHNQRLEEEKINDFFVETDSVDEDIESTQNYADNETKSNNEINYSMVIEIPKISLKKGIYGLNSKYNSVKYGIQVMSESNMPDIENGNLILASHRGNSSVSYFNNIYKLETGDKIYIYYNGVKYTYEFVNTYDEDKDGIITIHREYDKTVLTLITCKKNTNDKQIVLISNLVSKENY
jgi:sortase A